MHSRLLEKVFHLDLSALKVELCLADLPLHITSGRCSSRAMHVKWQGVKEPSPVADATDACCVAACSGRG